MPDILDPTMNSRDNLHRFLDAVENAELRQVLRNQLNQILTVGARGLSDDVSEQSREQFFRAIEELIEMRLQTQ